MFLSVVSRNRNTGFGEIPDHGEHEISFDRAIGILGDNAAADIPAEPVVLIEQVIDRGLQHQLVILQELFADPGVDDIDIVIRREYRRLLPDIEVAVGMDLQVERQKDIRAGLDLVREIIGGQCRIVTGFAGSVVGIKAKLQIVFLFLELPETEIEAIGTGTGCISDIVDNRDIIVLLCRSAETEVEIRFFDFKIVTAIDPIRIVAVDIHGLGRLLARGVIHRQCAADGIERERIGHASIDVFVGKYFIVIVAEPEIIGELRL